MLRVVTRLAAGRALMWYAGRLADRFADDARHAAAVQERLLLEKLRRNADSRFGREHGFAAIDSIESFRRAVPIRTYEDHEPYIADVKAGRLDALFGPGQRVHMFAMTSGTTANRKFIPVTDAFLAEYRRGWLIWGSQFFADHRAAMFTPILQVVSSPNEFRTEAGIPCGSISGLIAQMQRRLVRGLYCVPPTAAGIAATEAKYYLALRLSLPRKVGFITSANPNTLVRLARFGAAHAEPLIRDLADGTLSAAFDIPTDVRDALARRLRGKHRGLARQLDALVTEHGHLLPRHYWPTLGGIGTWKGGTVGLYLPELRDLYGPVAVRDIGLLASEGRMTVPNSDEGSAGVLDIWSHFYEFIPEAQADAASPTVLSCHELNVGETYFILLTTSAGLYRYNIFDLVRVTGYRGQAPVLEFLNKGAHISSLVGEKLSEHQVVAAVTQAAESLGLALSAFVVCPRWGDPPGYVLLVEDGETDPNTTGRLGRAADVALCAGNIEYESKRKSSRLAPLVVRAVPAGTWQQYDRRRQAATGGSLEQYKHPFLVTEMGFEERVEKLLDAAP